ncbi:hypothetical protein JCM12298_10660 [Desulfothermus naphthae]
MSDDRLEQLITSIHELKEGQDCLQRMMMEIKVEFGKIEERLQNGTRRFDQIDRCFDGIDKQYSGLEERVRKLENKLSAVYAVAGVIGASAGILPQLLAFLIKH